MITNITDAAGFEAFAELPGARALLFWRAEDEPSQDMKERFVLFNDHPTLSRACVNVAVVSPDLFGWAKVTCTPTLNLYWGKAELGQVIGYNARAMMKIMADLGTAETCKDAENAVAAELLPPNKVDQEELRKKMHELVNRAPVMLFMKGTRQDPYCRFSKMMLQTLEAQGVVNFTVFDILQDEFVRAGLKTIFNWPTYPQLYAEGRFIGGVDIVTQIVEAGLLPVTLPSSAFSA